MSIIFNFYCVGASPCGRRIVITAARSLRFRRRDQESFSRLARKRCATRRLSSKVANKSARPYIPPVFSRRAPSRTRRALPIGFIEPCLAVDADKVPSGPGWAHEIKHDGYRMQLRVSGGSDKLFTRRGFDWTERYPWVIGSAAKLRCMSATIDGELVCAGAGGIANFDRLDSRRFDDQAFLHAFDLMELDGEDLRPQPLRKRKAALAKLLRRGAGGLRLVEFDEGDGQALMLAACRMGLEGIVSKRLDSPYRSGRSRSWVKVKNNAAPGYLRVRENTEG